MTNALPPADTGTGQATPSRVKKMGDLDYAAAVRDVMAKIAGTAIDNGSSEPQKGRVVDVDFINYTAMVWFPGDEIPTQVNLFTSTLPGQWGTKFGRDVSSDTGIFGAGSQVLVSNFFNKLYVTEVLTGGQFSSDWSMAGSRQQAFGTDSKPEYVRAAEYVYKTQWNWQLYGNGGGPYAINIGPFLLADTIDVARQEAFNGNDGNGAWEIDVISTEAGSCTFEVGTWPFSLFNNVYAQVGDSGFQSSVDIWYRLLPTRYNMDGQSNGKTAIINPYTIAWDSIGGWDNSFDAQTSVTRSLTIPNPAFPSDPTKGNLAFQSTVSHATLLVGAGVNNRTPVMPNCSLRGFVYINPTVTTAAVTLGVRWYTAANSLISTSVGTNTNCPANTWTSVESDVTAPSNAAFAAFFIQVGGTPATSTIFYVNYMQWFTNDSVMMPSYTVDLAFRQTVHGSPDYIPQNSAGELWIRIYMDWLPPSSVDSNFNLAGNDYPVSMTGPKFIVRARNTGAFATAKSTKTGLPVYEYDTAPIPARGVYGYTDGNTGISGNPTFGSNGMPPGYLPSSGTWRNPELLTGSRVYQMATGPTGQSYKTSPLGGKRVKWTGNIEIAAGRTRRMFPLGYYTVAMPSVGTSIPIFPGQFGGITSALVDTDGIPLNANQSLWLYIPPGSTATALPTATYYNPSTFDKLGGYFIIDPKNDPGYFMPPEHAVMIARVNNAGDQMKFVDGQYYGGSVRVGDSLTAVSVPGTLDAGDEVFGTAIVVRGTGLTAPFGETVVSYSTLAGTGAVNVVLGLNSTQPFNDPLGFSYTAAGTTSTGIVGQRTSTSGMGISYLIKRSP